MVMRRSSAWTRNCAREVIRTLGRYLSIMAIIALGVGFFCGLKVTKKAMIKTFDTYADDCNMYDLQLLSTLGFTDDDVEQLVLTDGVLDAEGSFSIDAVAQIDGREQVLKVHSLTERINKLSLVSGRLPSSADECVLDADAFGSDVIGKSVTVTQTDAESDTLNEETYTVVGLVNSVCYISAERGLRS